MLKVNKNNCIWVFIAMILSFCSEVETKQIDNKAAEPVPEQIVKSAFQSILDSAEVNGSILIYDNEKETYYSNNFQWASVGKLPASTFKIPNSIIALETGVVENESTLFEWDGVERSIKNWNQDLIFRDAFHFSCVPCYQKVARGIGEKRMTKYLNKLDYGNMKVDSSNVDMFWLEGGSRISQFQQIDFLKRLNNSKLPISERTEKLMKRLMLIEDNENYKLSGKTGWSIRNGNNNGWFVGYIETKDQRYYFATNIEPSEWFDMKTFPMIRKQITTEALEEMGFI